MVLGCAELVALVARHQLAAVGLQVDSEEGETVERTEQLHRATTSIHTLHHIKVAANCSTPLAADVALIRRAEFRYALRTAELMARSTELDRVCCQDLRRRHFIAVAALVCQHAVVVAEFRKAGIAAKLMAHPTYHHLAQGRGLFGAHRAGRVFAVSRLTLLAAVCNCLVRATAGLPGCNNHAALVINCLCTIGTG